MPETILDSTAIEQSRRNRKFNEALLADALRPRGRQNIGTAIARALTAGLAGSNVRSAEAKEKASKEASIAALTDALGENTGLSSEALSSVLSMPGGMAAVTSALAGRAGEKSFSQKLDEVEQTREVTDPLDVQKAADTAAATADVEVDKQIRIARGRQPIEIETDQRKQRNALVLANELKGSAVNVRVEGKDEAFYAVELPSGQLVDAKTRLPIEGNVQVLNKITQEEAGNIGSAGLERPAARDKQKEAFARTKLSMRNMAGTVSRMKARIDEFGEKALSTPGALAKTVTSVVGQLRGLAQFAGLDKVPIVDLDTGDTVPQSSLLKQFEAAGIAKSLLNSDSIGLAKMILRIAEPTARSFSNFDVQNALQQVGSQTGSPASAKALLDNIVRGSMENLNNFVITSNEDFPQLNFQMPDIPYQFESQAGNRPRGGNLEGTERESLENKRKRQKEEYGF